jgi:crotonobetainyl-CoA hydratase
VSGTLVEYSVAGPVATVRINRPESLNALNNEVREGIRHMVEDSEAEPSIRVVILTGTGDRAFCAGADLKEMSSGRSTSPRSASGFGGLTRMKRTKPVIAAINGLAYGGGFELALACDMIVAAAHATFAFPEVLRGIVAGGGGALRLPHRLPRSVANEMLLTGIPMSASEALRWGLVNRVVERAELMKAAQDLAEGVCRAAPLAVTYTMEVAGSGPLQLEAASWVINDAAVDRARSTEDGREGPKAFAEKRPAVWTGR